MFKKYIKLKERIKNEKTKTQAGITLVALIITIIVLLILAVVAIRAVQGDGIIQHAKNATTTYKQAEANEITDLLEYEELINSVTPNFWQQKGLTSSNVKFDTIYGGMVGLYTDDPKNDITTEMHFMFYSNGAAGFDVVENTTELRENFSFEGTTNEVGDANVGNQGRIKAKVEYYLSEGTIQLFSNVYTAMLGNFGYHTMRFTADNKINVYFTNDENNLVGGHIPEDNEYLVGTLVPQ